MLNHSWGSWSVTIRATSLKKGVETRKCERECCDYEETRPIPTIPCRTCGYPCKERIGDINNNGEIDIMDAVEILKWLAGIPNIIMRCNYTYRAALVTKNSTSHHLPPDIWDALEILKYLAGTPNKLDEFWR
jgi:hypothetical protein